ncbi:hypothetical protein AURDEDRAFT_170886 [Auricularia subglabra TFB-10046 SS5]|nr:hypothetical protein AURDEDRAFT_170886 [Auricularia subglabra TFB-10046 SS5]
MSTCPTLAEHDPRILFPLEYPRAWSMFKAAQTESWTCEDVLFDSCWVSSDIKPLLALELADFVAGVCAVSAPAKILAIVRRAEFACFLSFQEMLHSVHHEVTATAVCNAPYDNGSIRAVVVPDWVEPITSAVTGGSALEMVHLSAFIAAASTFVHDLHDRSESDPVVRELARRISRDYDRFLNFALLVSAVVAALEPVDECVYSRTADHAIGRALDRCGIPASRARWVRGQFLASLVRERELIANPPDDSEEDSHSSSE